MGPRIETERLLMRLPEMGDAANISTFLGDYDVAKNTARVPHPYPILAAEMWVMTTRASWQPGGNLSLTVEMDGEVVGGGGVFKRTPDADWEIGYWIGKPWWGRGLATELGQGLVDYARDTLGTRRVIAGYYTDNPASGRVLEKLGFQHAGDGVRAFSMARMGPADMHELSLTL
ncbi:GNAT family N-acetyltransferase [Maricaulis sp.]|uniref:GNAT family N-acetyltransferase n=1 Tax=Maricaulis sp. TaxID=1486257 RepID=UPI0026346B57|nr:GNAT family N-acetyltransferase [Maricaulis sp.]MDF1767888.1 GNAT family N-acetyltransferase [Maricaulis sp.]